jgi:hypothetical protein
LFYVSAHLDTYENVKVNESNNNSNNKNDGSIIIQKINPNFRLPPLFRNKRVSWWPQSSLFCKENLNKTL